MSSEKKVKNMTLEIKWDEFMFLLRRLGRF